MAQIELDLSHSYVANPQADEDYALLPLKFTFRDGGAYALLGPSGCGKTTLLNCVSGLLRPSHGRILFDGQDVTHKTPQARNIAQVFQFPVVYDTMTVFDNLAFPLRPVIAAWPPGADQARRVGRIAEMLEMSQPARRAAPPGTTAADAKQKISLGRGLVRNDVSAVLFDEPLTVIDPQLKWELRRKLKEIHHEFKLTLIYVTHDQTEALTFADQVIVMTRGRAVQVEQRVDDLFEAAAAHLRQPVHPGSPGHEPAARALELRRTAWRWAGGASSATPDAMPAAMADGSHAQAGHPSRVRDDAPHREEAGAVPVVVEHGAGHRHVLAAVRARRGRHP